MTESAEILQPVTRARPWRFDLTLRMDALSGSDDVCISFKELLNNAQERIALPGLEQVSFFYDVPDEGLGAQISGYVHVNKNFNRIRESALRTWLYDARIIGEIEWRAVLPGKNRSWRQHTLVTSLFAACEGGSLRREDWVGESLDMMRRGGRPSKAQTQTGGAADAAGRRVTPSQFKVTHRDHAGNSQA